MNITSTLSLENVNQKKLIEFIEHWHKNMDLPYEKIEFENKNNPTILKIIYSTKIFDKSITQLLAILIGEISTIESFGKLKIIDIDFPSEVYEWFNGPKYGADYIKER